MSDGGVTGNRDGARPGGAESGNGRLLLTPKWLLGHLLALLLIVLFVNFGFWQVRRLELRTERNELIAQRIVAEPRPLSELLAASAGPSLLAYRRASASGRFAPGAEVLLRSRSRQGEAGWHVLTPLVQDNGRALLVDRGWVPYRMDEPPLEDAPPPAGEVELEGLVRLGQTPPAGWVANFAPRDPTEGRLQSAYYVNIERLAKQLPYPLEPVYLELASQSPERPNDLPLPPEPPELERGPHLSYALQWFSFAIIGLVGYLLLLRRTARGM